MSDTKVPDAPNYAPYLTAFQDIANAAKTHGDDALKWAQDQVANNKDLLSQVTKGLVDTQTSFTDAAKQRLQQAGGAIDTGLSNLKDQYSKYTDPARKAADIGAAEAGAAQGNEAARKASMAELESYGLNPGDVRYAGLDAGLRLQDAATRVGAGNIASRTDDALADQTNQQILTEGNALAGQANANAGTGAGAGTGAVGAANTTTGTGAGVLGTGLQWTGAGTNAVQGGVSTKNTDFTNRAKSDEISNSSSSGLGTIAGLGLSALGKGGALASGGALAFLEDGGAVDDIGSMYAGGGAVPDEMSPSGGAAIDDVDAVAPGGPAKLNAGEFVVPEDATAWLGEKFFQNLILKARKEKEGAQAKPQTKPAGPDPADPAFQPRPQSGAQAQGALPV